ncbi:MAG: hypothetical protein IJ285_06860 [Clostridia bacterium]|nr:hypothetical protein [Clostridia bacterium]
MAILYSFLDNVSYGTDDINNITRRLVGAGVAPFPAKDSYSTSDLNLLTEAVAASGVMLDGCKCSLLCNGDTNEISVAQGIVYFDNGATLEVDSEGFQVTVQADTEGVVYAYFDTGLQYADILFSQEMPTNGLSVLLARVNSDNTLTDARSFARSKVATFGTNIVCTAPLTEQTPVAYETSRYIIATAEADISQYNYALITATQGDLNKVGGIFDLKKARFVFSVRDNYNPSWNSTFLYSGSPSGLQFGFDVINGKLCYVLHCANGTIIKDYDGHYETNIILM